MKKQKLFLALHKDYFEIEKNTHIYDIINNMKYLENYEKEPDIPRTLYNTNQKDLEEEIEKQKYNYTHKKMDEENIQKYYGGGMFAPIIINNNFEKEKERIEQEFGEYYILKLNVSLAHFD